MTGFLMKQQELSNSWRIVIIVLIACFTVASYSQSNNESGIKDNWSVNVNAGTNLYYGDIDNYRFFRVFDNNSGWRMGAGFYVQKGMNNWLSFRGQFIYGGLTGTKRASNIWFEGHVIETSVSAKVDALKLIWPRLDKRWTVFATGGLGLAQWKTQLMEYPSNIPLEGDGNFTGSNNRKLGLVIPFGLGFDFMLNEKWSLNFETTIRMVGSDQLDGKEGGFKYDFYSYNFVGVTYSFDKKKPARKPYMPPRELAVEDIPITPEAEVDSTEIARYKQEVEQKRSLEEKLMDAEADAGLYKTPWPGIEFKVQIAAARNYIDPEVFAKKFNLDARNIQVQVADGWYRYSTGKHIKYWQAREYKNILLTTHNAKGAFVVAYRDDERIMLTDLVNAEPIIDGKFFVQKLPVVDIGYAVQILATKHTNPPIVAIKEMFGIDETIYKEFSEGFYHYTVGILDSLEEAIELRDKIQYRGIKSAFIVGFLDGERIVDINAE